MNLAQLALIMFITLVFAAVFAASRGQGGAHTTDAVLCTTAGGTPVRIDGVTHCFSSTIFISTQE